MSHEIGKLGSSSIGRLFEDIGKGLSIKESLNLYSQSSISDQGTPLLECAYNRKNYQALEEITALSFIKRRFKNAVGDTLLHRACREGNKAAVTILTRDAADVFVQNKLDTTPFQLAAVGTREVFNILYEAGRASLDGLSPDAQQDSEFSLELNYALGYACSYGDVKAIDYLIQKGGDLSYQLENGDTARGRCIFRNLSSALIDQFITDPYTVELVKRKALFHFFKFSGSPTFLDSSSVDSGAFPPYFLSSIGNLFSLFSSLHSVELSQREAAIFSFDAEKIIGAFNTASRPIDVDGTVTSIRKGELVLIPTGWHGHAIVIVFYKNYMAIVNRGGVYPGMAHIEMFRVDPQKVNEALISNILKKSAEGEASPTSHFFYFELPLDLSPCSIAIQDLHCLIAKKYSPKEDLAGVCSWTSSKAAFRCALMMLAMERGGSFSEDAACKESVQLSKEYFTFVRIKELHKYLQHHYAANACYPLGDPDKKDPDTALIHFAYEKILKRINRDPSKGALCPLSVKAFSELMDQYGQTLLSIQGSSR